MNDSDDRAFGRTPDAMDETIVDETLGVENRDANDMPRVSDDTDLGPQGSGVEATPWRREYLSVALRSDLARMFEALIAGVNEWATEDGRDDARALAADLEDLYGRIEAPTEATDRTTEGAGPKLDSPA